MTDYIYTNEVDPAEMLRLRGMLAEAGVRHVESDGYLGPHSYSTATDDFAIANGTCVAGFSCVLSFSSYGHQVGALELWAKGMDDPEGWLSAKDVMRRLRKAGLA